jgi:dTDP-glucose 4,6-dehydratase
MTSLDGARAVVLGGAGFLGSHLCDRLLAEGSHVTAVDNLATGRISNIEHLAGRPGFAFVEADITEGIAVAGGADLVLNLASPASPPDYLAAPIATLRVGSVGTENGLRFALEHGARFVQASTSEVYGDPAVNPQPETYWGNVNPIGPRSVYDEAKRYGEAVVMAYRRAHGADVGIMRIFNTYGPRMRPDDGRAVPEFFLAALDDRPLPVHGDGFQTRSLCFVEDLIDGIVRLAASSETGPVNLGNPHEVTILELAGAIQDVVGNHPGVELHPRPTDDPTVRRPDIALANRVLGWAPKVALRDGLERTLGWFAGPRR